MLLAQFGVVSLVPTVALGFVLAAQMRTTMERRALSIYAATDSAIANVLARSALEAALTPAPAASVSTPSQPDHPFALMEAMALSASDLSVMKGSFGTVGTVMASLAPVTGPRGSARFVDMTGKVLFSVDGADVGTMAAPSKARSVARTGRTYTKWLKANAAERAEGGRPYEMAFPISFRGIRIGTFEVVTVDHELTKTAAKDAHAAWVVLAVGLTLLWLTLTPIVWRVSRRLARQSKENERLAMTDALTGLPNRSALLRSGQELMDSSAVSALLLIDLDNFKDVNDTLGHGAGDRLLRHVADVLRSVTREDDLVARLGGDEFAVLVPGSRSSEEVELLASRIEAALGAPTAIDDVLVTAGSSTGIALAPEHGTLIESLVQRADIAMYASKERSSGPVFYTTDIDLHSPSRLALTAELTRALEREEEIRVVFQPIVEARTGRIVAVETLGRWDNPGRGAVPPNEFVWLAERSGLIRTLTERIMTLACEQLRLWRAAGYDLLLSVNVSTANLSETDLPERLHGIVRAHGLSPTEVTLELTETNLFAETSDELSVVNRLRLIGFRLGLDDFGTGYSSLTYLRTLRAKELKIDRSFVRQITESPNDAKIVGSLIDMAHGLDMVVVAEGVETLEQGRRLQELGGDWQQGFLYSRPVPGEQITAMLESGAMLTGQPDVTDDDPPWPVLRDRRRAPSRPVAEGPGHGASSERDVDAVSAEIDLAMVGADGG